MKIVKVKWTDAQKLELGVRTLEEIRTIEPITCEIVGFQIYRDKNKIILAQEVWQDNYGAKYVNIIPMCSVASVEELKVVK